ncbi:hypothetical protein Taro_041256 [Colocasia esculenta]|uniref:Uncharacterized protein n=1 Tax=Colocasia esculenta TaxID=4460 RepID=A0A843WSX8_COLES|nr:hypothetical protein [Colocasia esculenta]
MGEAPLRRSGHGGAGGLVAERRSMHGVRRRRSCVVKAPYGLMGGPGIEDSGTLSYPCTGVEAGARLASRACGLRVPFLAASGGGLVVVVVAAFPHDVSKCSSLPVRGGTGVCGFPTWRCVRVVVWSQWYTEGCFRCVLDSVGFYGSRVCVPTSVGTSNPYWALFTRLTPLLPSAKGSWLRELGVGRVAEAVVALGVVSSISWVVARPSGPLARVREIGSLQWYQSEESTEICVRFPCMIRARGAGCSCCCAAYVASVVARHVRTVAARLALDSLAVVFLVWRTLAGKSRIVCGTSGRCPCLVGCPSVVGVCVVLVLSLRHLPMVVVGLVLTGCEL